MPDVFQLLEQDHRTVQDLLTRIERSHDGREREAMFRNVKNALELHSRFEEEKFYPSARKATGLNDEIEDDLEEHEEADLLMNTIAGLDASSKEWMERVKDLRRTLDHHIRDEEERLFPQARRKFDKSEAEAMGNDYQQRKRLAS